MTSIKTTVFAAALVFVGGLSSAYAVSGKDENDSKAESHTLNNEVETTKGGTIRGSEIGPARGVEDRATKEEVKRENQIDNPGTPEKTR